MELRHLRYFVAVGEEQHYGRASRRLRVAQPALSRQIQDLEEEVGFKLFERLPRGVKLNPAGKLFLEDARRILQEVSDAAARAGRVPRGRSGTLRVGFTENSSWRGVVPDSFRRFRQQQPDAELQLHPAPSLDQMEVIRSGRLDAGFVNFMPKADPELDQLTVANQHVELAVPKRHPFAELRKLRLRDLVDAAFVWFPRWASPAFYDQMMEACYRGGLKSPRIVQEGNNEANRVDRAGCGMGSWNRTLAVPCNRCHLACGRFESSSAARAGVEKRQYLSLFRVSVRKRPQSRICAFQAISRAVRGAAPILLCMSLLTRGGNR
jgi:DNA-binding transcriptional LysR family regulator